MLISLMEAVEEFHDKMHIGQRCEFPIDKITDAKTPLHNQMHFAALQLKTAALMCEDALKDGCDPRILRLHLIMEECGELITAMLLGHPIDSLDGLGDLIYVLTGTAAQFDWDLSEALIRIHDSNMTKEPKAGPRLREKGSDYTPVKLGDLV